jgi:hypothetical protein
VSGVVRRAEVPQRVRSALSEPEPVHYLDACATFLDPARFGHLDFRGSMLLEEPGPEGSRLVVSTLVHSNNRFGPVYFAVVQPFHQLLMRLMLRSRFH